MPPKYQTKARGRPSLQLCEEHAKAYHEVTPDAVIEVLKVEAEQT
jgi:hypothetical protein